MDERELEHAIDVAGKGIVAREPSRALSQNVMARVRAGSAAEPWRFKWVALSTGTVLCAILYTVMNRTAIPAFPQFPQAAPLPIARIASAPVVPADALREIPPTRIVSARIQRAAVSVPAFPRDDETSIEAIEMQPIAVTAIEVPQLEREAMLVDPIEIESLTIEPLAASND